MESNKSENRNCVLAATNKMDYICSALNRVGWEVEIVSASGTKSGKSYPGKRISINDYTTLTLFPTIGRGNKIKNIIQRLLLHFHFFCYLLKYIEKGQPILIYHSLRYLKAVRILKKLKKIHLILEVEEIYADVIGSRKWRKREMRLFDLADSFIFSTELLDESINLHKKPSVIIYGTYQAEKERICRNEYSKLHGWDEDKIHCVYAGTFDPRKGGAIAAAAAAEYLPDMYHIHILGFGNQKEIQNMQELIAELAGRCKCTVTYDGLLSGEDYIQFIQSCDIGLSTQDPGAAFNATSFPSKILSYMANGLRVVSIRIPAVKSSDVGEYMYYYERQTPQEIAGAIMKVDMNDGYDNREVIRRLDRKFRNEMNRMLEEVIH